MRKPDPGRSSLIERRRLPSSSFRTDPNSSWPAQAASATPRVGGFGRTAPGLFQEIPRPSLPGLGQPRDAEQTARVAAIPVVDAKDIPDGDIRFGLFHDPDPIPG